MRLEGGFGKTVVVTRVAVFLIGWVNVNFESRNVNLVFFKIPNAVIFCSWKSLYCFLFETLFLPFLVICGVKAKNFARRRKRRRITHRFGRTGIKYDHNRWLRRWNYLHIRTQIGLDLVIHTKFGPK